MHSPIRRRVVAPLAIAVVAALGLAACGSSSKPAASTGSGGTSSGGGSTTLRLGYFPNITHAPALIGVANGSFASKLGPNVNLKLSTFNSGTEASTALLAGAIDASFVGPNPAINAFQKSHGAVRIVAGTASGGAFLVVKPSINSAADLKGKKVATPQLGNTQDVALRTWLNNNGLHETKSGGDVTVVPEDNSVTLTAFEQGTIDGAWVPEPYASRMVSEGGGKVLVNEATLWPAGKFTTTVLARQQELPRRARRRRSEPDLGAVRFDQPHHIQPGAGPAAREPTVGEGERQGTQARCAHCIVPTHHVHARSDRIIDADRGRTREGARLAELELTSPASSISPLVNKVLAAEGKPAVQS